MKAVRKMIGQQRLGMRGLAGYLAAVLISLHFVLAFSSVSEAVVLDPNKDYLDARDQSDEHSVSRGAVANFGRGEWIRSKFQAVKTTFGSMSRQFFSRQPAKAQQSSDSGTRAVTNRGLESQAARLPVATSPVFSSESSSLNATRVTGDGFAETVSFPGLSTSENGVVKYDMQSVDVVPRLRLPKEQPFRLQRFELSNDVKRTLETNFLIALQSPDLLPDSEMRRLTKAPDPVRAVAGFKKMNVAKGALDEATLKKLGLLLIPLQQGKEGEITLTNFEPLTADEFRFMSGLLLYQSGHQCAAAVGLFHSISKKPEWQSEADYFLAMCSKSLGLMTDFSDRVRKVLEVSGPGSTKPQSGFYANRLLREIDWKTPNVTTREFGEALEKAVLNPEVVNGQTPEVMATVAALIAESAAASEKFKTALEWAKKVPEKHPRFLQAKFVEALAEYSIGSKKRALEMQEGLIKNPRAEESEREFQGLIALNLARMYFQEQKYKEAHQSFLTVNKDHPLWLQGLSELGWAQLMSGDYEGAIGNMYSIHSPFFAAAYKPESYVIRTIGYLNLCQYGDAYRTLTVLEKDYRLMLENIDAYEKSIKSLSDGRYGTVRRFLVSFNQPGRTDLKDVDGLPSSVIREIARQKDFLNLQKALNRQIDEKGIYARIGKDIDRSLKDSQDKVNQSRLKLEQLRKQLAAARKRSGAEMAVIELQTELDRELDRLNDRFFSVDLFNEAKRSVAEYDKEVGLGAENRGQEIKQRLERTIANQILKIRTDLSRFMDNNELLRYEVFAASGENIRFQVAGGQKENRVPASAIPKSKSLKWDFDGEYWEDEIGHYRSSLKNNCPISDIQEQREQASLGGR
jgi:tetratricopeptide (TPR) repeat protein